MGIHALNMGREVRKLKWRNKLQKMVRHETKKITRKVGWRSIEKDRRPLALDTGVEKLYGELGIAKEKQQTSKNTGGFKEERAKAEKPMLVRVVWNHGKD